MKNTVVSSKLKLVSQTTNLVKEQIKSSKKGAEILREIYRSHDLDLNFLESAFVLFLSRNSTLIGYAKLSEGGTAGTVIDPKYLFSLALKHTNTSTPILDHIILTEQSYYSFAENDGLNF